jgi:hypothetical protein
MMKRRQLLQATATWPLTQMSAGVLAQDKWGQGQGVNSPVKWTI